MTFLKICIIMFIENVETQDGCHDTNELTYVKGFNPKLSELTVAADGSLFLYLSYHYIFENCISKTYDIADSRQFK